MHAISTIVYCLTLGWQKLCEGMKGEKFGLGQNFKFIRYFVAVLRFVAIYALFEDFRQEKCFFWGRKQCFFVQKVHYHMVYIAYLVKVANLRLRSKTTYCLENCKYELNEIFLAIFAPDERLPSSATLLGRMGNLK